MADLARSAILMSVALAPILVGPLGDAHAATTVVPAEALVTKATFGRYRLRLWHGSIRLNVDELPLITKDRYALRIGGRNLSYYTWRDLRTDRGADSFRWESPDRGGQLVRQLAFHEDGFELRFRLTLRPELTGEVTFSYELSIEPEFLYGTDDRPGGTLVALVGKSRTRRDLELPHLLALRKEGYQPSGVTDCRAMELSWHGDVPQRKLTIEILNDDSWRMAFYDSRLTTMAYAVRISRAGGEQGAARIEFALRFRLE